MKKQLLRWLLTGLAVSVLGVAGTVDLKDAVIVRPDVMKGWEEKAVDDLRTALERISGGRYEAVPEGRCPDSGVQIYVGATRAAAAAGIDMKGLGPQQFQIRVVPGAVYIAGGSPTGTSYGVSTFLQDEFGVYQLDWDCIVYPKNPAPSTKEQDRTCGPDIAEREIYNNFFRSETLQEAHRAWGEYFRRNRVSWAEADRTVPGFRNSYQVPQSHSFFAYVPPEKFFKSHPEYYSMHDDGQRRCSPYGQLCLTNPDVRRIALESLAAFVRKDRAESPGAPPTLYDLSQEDETAFLCRCPECRKFLAAHGNNDCALNLDFVNHVAAGIRKSFPDVHLRTFAYVSTETPPEGVQIEDNVWVRYCDLYSCSNHLYPLADPVNAARLELFQKWMSACPRLELWDYLLATGGTPLTAVDSIIADTRLFAASGLQKIFVESEYRFFEDYRPQTFHILQYFLQAQLLFDASQDPERLINVFLEGYHGAAAPEMKAYLALLRQAQQKDRTTSMALWHTRVLAHVKKPFLEEARDLILRGMAKVQDDKRLHARAARELINVNCSLLRLLQGDPRTQERRGMLRRELDSAVREHLRDCPMQEKNRAALLTKLADDNAVAEMRFADLPGELAALPESRLTLVPYIHQIYYQNSHKVRDADSSQPFSMRWVSPKNEYHLPVPIGVYGRISKLNRSVQIERVSDERYHWYKIGDFTLDPSSLVYALDWHIGMELKDFHIQSDGLGGAPNQVEVWVSVKMQGPAYVPGSSRDNGFFMDRAVLVRKNAPGALPSNP